jgi:hypothetical protein
MEIDYINQRIQKEICLDTINLLTDTSLLEKYKQTKSLQKNIIILKNILSKNNILEEQQDKIIDEYVLYLIPAGTKGVIKGNLFNKIVKNTILSSSILKDRFEIKFESHHPLFSTTEKPDWYVYDKYTNKIMIGMNQLDLWNGGQQLNRGNKYLINNKFNTDNSKLVCVICNPISIKNNKTKVYNLFDIGFSNNTLCYIKGLPQIITDYFNSF